MIDEYPIHFPILCVVLGFPTSHVANNEPPSQERSRDALRTPARCWKFIAVLRKGPESELQWTKMDLNIIKWTMISMIESRSSHVLSQASHVKHRRFSARFEPARTCYRFCCRICSWARGVPRWFAWPPAKSACWPCCGLEPGWNQGLGGVDGSIILNCMG